MKSALIGYTGFVGGTLMAQRSFDDLYNSKNINDIRGQSYDELYISGLPATKWIANQKPQEDWDNVLGLFGHIKTVQAKTVYLISTVDVYGNNLSADENTPIDLANLHAYGKNRLLFERMVSEIFPNIYIVRLAGLFGQGLKKNIIFDFLNNNQVEKIESRNSFQFYNMAYLNRDLQKIVQHGLRAVNLVPEPVKVKEVAQSCFGKAFENHLATQIVSYNVKSIHAGVWGSNNGFMYSKESILKDIRTFANNYKNEIK